MITYLDYFAARLANHNLNIGVVLAFKVYVAYQICPLPLRILDLESGSAPKHPINDHCTCQSEVTTVYRTYSVMVQSFPVFLARGHLQKSIRTDRKVVDAKAHIFPNRANAILNQHLKLFKRTSKCN